MDFTNENNEYGLVPRGLAVFCFKIGVAMIAVLRDSCP
jgi:hypothetical protein